MNPSRLLVNWRARISQDLCTEPSILAPECVAHGSKHQLCQGVCHRGSLGASSRSTNKNLHRSKIPRFSLHVEGWDSVLSITVVNLQDSLALFFLLLWLIFRTIFWGGYLASHFTDGKVKVKSLSRVRLFATPWTVAHQASPSVGFSRQEYWSGLPLSSPGDLPDPGIEPRFPALQADALTSEPPGKPHRWKSWCQMRTRFLYYPWKLNSFSAKTTFSLGTMTG